MKISLTRINRIVLVNLSIILIFFSIVIPGIIWDRNTSFQAVDQNKYHLRQVETFVKTPITWGNYTSSTATTPGHHLALSWVSKHFSNSQVGRQIFSLRFANALFSLGLLLILWWLAYLGGTGNVIQTTYLVLPLLFSYQFLGSAIWVMTDNGALFWVCLTLSLLTLPTFQKRETLTLTLAGIFAALAIAWRQTHVWLLLPLFLSVSQTNSYRQRWELYFATLLPPLLVLAYFLYLWHGLTPPEFQSHYAPGFNLAVPAYVISLFGIFGSFYIGYLGGELQKIKTRQLFGLIVISAIVGFSIAILFPSTYNRDAGRWGGWLWEIARYLPSVYDRSLLFLVLVPLGTVLISLWFKVVHHDKNTSLILFSMMALIAVHIANFQVFQRYYEALILIVITLLASRQTKYFRYSFIGPLILASLMAAISLQQIVFE